MMTATFIVVQPSVSEASCRLCSWTYKVGHDSGVSREQRAAKVNLVALLHRASHQIKEDTNAQG